MKKLYILLVLLLIAVVNLTAQPPQAFKYKAVARDRYGRLLILREVNIRISILQGSETGPAVFVESHTTKSNLFGIIELEIGRGTPESGDFLSIDWGLDDYYIKIELDPRCSGNYTIIGTAQLLSVPYALYAGNVSNSSDDDPDPENELITDAYLCGTFLEITEGGNLTIIDLSGLQDGVEDMDADPANELQDIYLSGTELSITDGSTVDLSTLPDNVEDADADPQNEIQDLQLAGNILIITKNGTATEIDLSIFLDDTDTHLTEAEVDAMVENNGYLTSEADGDVTNEIQDISIDDHMLTISGGSTVQIPDSVNDADHDPDNEIQVLGLNGNILTLSTNGAPYEVDLSLYMDNTDVQSLLIDGHQLTILNGNTIQLPDSANDADADPENELITNVALNGTVLEITDAGGTNTADLSSLSNGTGNQTLSEVLTLGNSADGNNIANLANPINQQDAATKAYVDVLESKLEALETMLIEIGGYQVNDADGNTYSVVKIGAQAWMVENLKTTTYNDGTPIPLVTDNTEWSNLTTPGYCWYNNDEPTYKDTYGALYNWYTVNTGNLCPTGWHVPSDDEWTILIDYYLCGAESAGGKLKEDGTTHWTSPNVGATNETGFTALPGGYRYPSGPFYSIGDVGYWWSSTEHDPYQAWNRLIYYYSGYVSRGHDLKENVGCSVRCIKD